MPRYVRIGVALAAASLASSALVLAVFAADTQSLKVRPAHKYPAHQKQSDVTAAVMPYHTEKDMKEAFGKAKPFKQGVMPILLVITNESDHALGLDNLKVRYITSGREGLEPVTAEDLAYVRASSKPKDRPSYIPRVPGIGGPKVKKGPLADSVYGQREFKAPVIPPQSSVSGFFYYLTGTEPDPVPGAAIYISGIRNLTTGQELFYFEIPLDPYKGKN